MPLEDITVDYKRGISNKVGSTTALNERLMSLWISMVLPSPRSFLVLRGIRVGVALGNIPYSEVIQPSPDPEGMGELFFQLIQRKEFVYSHLLLELTPLRLLSTQ